MVVEDGSEPANVDPGLIHLLLRAHVIRARLLEEPNLPLKEIAAEEGISGSYVTRLLRLAFLAPDVVTAILNGRHPPQLTPNRLMDHTACLLTGLHSEIPLLLKRINSLLTRVSV